MSCPGHETRQVPYGGDGALPVWVELSGIFMRGPKNEAQNAGGSNEDELPLEFLRWLRCYNNRSRTSLTAARRRRFELRSDADARATGERATAQEGTTKKFLRGGDLFTEEEVRVTSQLL